MLDGHYQRGGHSAQVEAHLAIDAQGRVSCPEAAVDAVDLSMLEISPRLGNSRRYINFPDGGCFETDDNDTVDRWVRQYRHRGRRGLLLHRLEASAPYVAVATLVTALFAYGLVAWGLPWLSTRAAYALPHEVSASLGRGTLEFLDRHLLSPSDLAPRRQRALEVLFARLSPPGTGFDLRLELRTSEAVGANAFALPDGTVVLTDELAELAENEQQIAAVMLHEIGHVVGRHGLRGTLHNAGIATLLVVIAGDVAAADSFFVTLPVLLVQTSYSRAMETEADLYAVRAMLGQQMDPAQLIGMLHLLEQAHSDPADHGSREKGWLDYSSTHPLGEERFAPLRRSIAQGGAVH